MNIICIVTARMGSQRMFGKPMKDIAGKSIIEHCIDRMKTSKLINKIIIATSEKKENDVFVEFAKEQGLDCFRGDEEDVLDRFVKCAEKFRADQIVRVTSENPLMYVENLDEVIKTHLETKSDITYTDKLPLGCFVEVISFKALKTSHEKGVEKHHSELVTLFIKENPKMFKTTVLEAPKELQRPKYRLTVDTEKDLKLMNEIFSKLYKKGKIVKLRDAVKLLDKNHEMLKINSDIEVGTSWIWG